MRRTKTVDPVVKRCKTEKQREAKRELFLLTDEDLNPHWFDNPRLVKRRDELLAILEPEPTEDDLMEEYFTKRPGLKDSILSLLESGATNTKIYETIGVCTQKPVGYLRRKYGYVTRSEQARAAKRKQR